MARSRPPCSPAASDDDVFGGRRPAAATSALPGMEEEESGRFGKEGLALHILVRGWEGALQGQRSLRRWVGAVVGIFVV
jgi:hypothetical protein